MASDVGKKRRRFQVTIVYVTEATVEIEADDEDDAVETAFDVVMNGNDSGHEVGWYERKPDVESVEEIRDDDQ